MVAFTTMTGREFNRDVSKAKRQARHGPVVITSRGRAAHVLLTMEEYLGLAKQDVSIVKLLAMPEAAEIDFDPPRLEAGMYRPAALSWRSWRDVYLLDTNVVSELRRVTKANRNVVAWANDAPAHALFVSAITVLELEYGVLLVERRDEAQGAVLRSWLDGRVMPAFTGRVLSVDATVAKRSAAFHVPDPRSERDALIAATASVYGFVVVTRNVGDFAGTGVETLNPWESESRGTV